MRVSKHILTNALSKHQIVLIRDGCPFNILPRVVLTWCRCHDGRTAHATTSTPTVLWFSRERSPQRLNSDLHPPKRNRRHAHAI